MKMAQGAPAGTRSFLERPVPGEKHAGDIQQIAIKIVPPKRAS